MLAKSNKKIVLILCFLMCVVFVNRVTAAAAVAAEIVVEVPKKGSICFTPQQKFILDKEFNVAARELYLSYLYKSPIRGKTAFADFGKSYPDLSDLPEKHRKFIENIDSVIKVFGAYAEKLDELEHLEVPPSRLLPLIQDRRSLLLCAAHCVFDFTNAEDSALWRAGVHFLNVASGTTMIPSVTVDLDGTIQKLLVAPKAQAEFDCQTHPRYGSLRRYTGEFISGLLKLDPVRIWLVETNRLQIQAVKEEKVDE